MGFSTLRAHVLLSALVALPFASATHWIFGGTQPVVTTRLDPIVNPGGIGTHVHSVVGASGFSDTYDYDTLTQSACTTVVVPQDKSNYWAPQLYHQDATNGSFRAMPTSFNVYYLVRGTNIKAIPKGLRMVAGDTNRRTYDASSFADQAVSYVCLDYSGAHNNDPDWAERPNFFDHNCPNGMRAQIFFPSCWDGVNLDSADHKSHMAYPIQNYNNGDCPASHPVHLVSIFYEMLVSVDQFDYHGPGTWVFANGDPTGYAMHGDFQMGWTDTTLLQNAIDNCPNALGNVADCPPLAAVMDSAAASACRYEGEIVNEDIGAQSPIAALPGCNPVWDGTGTKPGCPSNITPALVSTQEPLTAGWTELGCIAEGTNGRALTSASTTDPAMTKNNCAAFCGAKGFQYAGVEWGVECYCGNTFSNGASKNTVAADQCANACGGNQFETCGGSQRLTLLFNPTPGQTPASSAAPVKSAVPSIPIASSLPVSSVVSSASVASSVPVSSPSVVSSIVASTVPVISSTSAVSSVAASTVLPVPTPSVVSTIVTVIPTVSVTSQVLIPSSVPSAPVSTPPASNGTSGWTEIGCIAEGTNGRALTAAQFTDSAMTKEKCSAFCGVQGFQYAGVEWSVECYCGNTFDHGASANTVPASQCTNTCGGNKADTCGGPQRLTLLHNPSPAAPKSSGPSGITFGWTASSCVTDNGQRTLNQFSAASDQMTASICVSMCDARGFSIAGVEYGRECYCGNSFVNGGGKVLSDSSCSMQCPTDKSTCGGSFALSTFKKATSAKKRASLKAKHFGRHNMHNTF